MFPKHRKLIQEVNDIFRFLLRIALFVLMIFFFCTMHSIIATICSNCIDIM